MRFTKFAGLVLTAMTISASALADDAANATAMVKKAVSYIKDHGKEKALAEFSNPSGEFKKGELYIFVTNVQGKMLAHGANAKLIGKDLMDLKDADGKPFVKEYTDLANAKGSGWSDYKWVNPNTKAIEHKSTYVQKVDDLVVGCGIYNK
ncbi:cache domain-containing protein [Noviherbaspirillum saxi]|uniref:Histidine kinase n=1 Tax=Noviherbaspirillum saxi TaxID=2320863 RepID=A0A3A3FWJ6_9BURK|nr:cache domain-containing protein [Noviherbaspirillum saxi]RJF98998.1 histidine kinase [Noviherbaspirillum saxi]